MGKLGELAVYYQKKGLHETLSRIRRRYFGVMTFVHYQRNLRYPFQGELPDDDIDIVVNDYDLLDRERKTRNDLPREFYVDKTHHCNHFYLVYSQGLLAGIWWVFKKGEYSRFFRIESNACCELNYLLILPQFRGNRLSTKFTNYVCADLRGKQFEKIVLSISAGNISFLKTMADVNFSVLKEVKSIFSLTKKTVV